MILLLNYIQNVFEKLLSFIFSVNFLILIFLIINIYHVLLYLFRDRNFLKNLKKFEDVSVESISQLNEILPITIIIPAWKEGENLKQCLNSINKLNYPKIKVILNAGGSNETIKIADSYKTNHKFTVIHQKAGGGKLRAINDCLKYASKGIIYLIDADILLDDKILLAMIYPLVNGKENIVIASVIPHSSIISNDVVKYLYINRNSGFRKKFIRYFYGFASNAIIRPEVIEAIEGFSEKTLLDDGRTTQKDLASKGYKSFRLVDYKIQSLTYPTNIKEYLNQNIRWIENFLYFSIKKRKFSIIKFIGVEILSIFFLFLPLINDLPYSLILY
ncbi:hypothetical protein LCGC14_1637200 [marine sediment metagenome]|uniref:Glycosyltransferase 2-like domain-containing protein n=1 Tax=marine sediment metagenome TaxID=412755 RepID=A0A0F9I173_9ZZZZ